MANKKIEFDDYFYLYKKSDKNDFTLSEISKKLTQVEKRQHINNLNKFIELGYIEKFEFWKNKKIKINKYKLTGKLPENIKEDIVLISSHVNKLIKRDTQKFKKFFADLSQSYINMAGDIFEQYYKNKE